MSTRLSLAAAAAALLVAGCGGSSTPSALQRTEPPSPAGSAAASTAAPAAAAPGASPAAQSAAPTASAATGQTAPQPAAAAPAASAGSGPTWTAPGRYTYDDSGTVTAGTPQQVDGTATLTVDKPAAGRQHSVLKGDQGSTTEDVVVRSTGTLLARIAMTNPAFSKEFAPPSPVLLVPDPAAPGRTWSWTATSTDGKTHCAVTARVGRTETITVGGVRTATSVVESTLKLTGDVTYTGQMQTWYDAAHHLQVKDHTKGSGTFSGFAFTTDITSVLRSTQPS